MQAAEPRDQLVARAQEQVIGVAEDDCGADRLEVAVQRRLDAALRADGHERRRLDDAVRRVEPSEPRRAIRRTQREAETGSGHVYY